MRLVTIRALNYLELTEKAKLNADYWLDDSPIELDDEENKTIFVYPSDWEDKYVDEFCQANGYLFDENGKPIHNLIED